MYVDEFDVRLKARGTGKIELDMDSSNVSLGEIAKTATGWQFLAVTWSDSGDLQRNFNGVHQQISSNFAHGFRINLLNGAYWKIGGKENSIYGKVAQLNIWYRVLPPPALMAMSRGMNGIYAYDGITSLSFRNYRFGKVVEESGPDVYLPDFVIQNQRDEKCNAYLSKCKYRARLGWQNGYGRQLACFCEKDLSKDMNFNHGTGKYYYGARTTHYYLSKI